MRRLRADCDDAGNLLSRVLSDPKRIRYLASLGVVKVYVRNKTVQRGVDHFPLSSRAERSGVEG